MSGATVGPVGNSQTVLNIHPNEQQSRTENNNESNRKLLNEQYKWRSPNVQIRRTMLCYWGIKSNSLKRQFVSMLPRGNRVTLNCLKRQRVKMSGMSNENSKC
jgi:hypothetical protein